MQHLFTIPLVLHLASFAEASVGSINIPSVEFNSALGQTAHASSFYNFDGNPVFGLKYEPRKGNDGHVLQSSWWSSGNANETVFWQLNYTVPPEAIEKIVIRWHGYQTAKDYRVRIAYGNKFRTLLTIKDLAPEWDRVDVLQGKAITAIQFLRIEMDVPNLCSESTACQESLTDDLVVTGPAIYGIREVEVWSTGVNNGASHVIESPRILLQISTMLFLLAAMS